MFRRHPSIARGLKFIAIAVATAAITSCGAGYAVQGQADIANEYMFADDHSNFPGGGGQVLYPLVMIVGPPGAVSCGLTADHQRGAPWYGNVDSERSVVVALPQRYSPHYRTTVRYQCLVATPEHPEGELIVRDVPNIDFPVDQQARDRRYQQLVESFQRLCPQRPRLDRLLSPSCDPSQVQYTPERSIQPKIVHVGVPDAEAVERWARLRASYRARCGPYCRDFENTWDEMQRADLGSAPGG